MVMEDTPSATKVHSTDNKNRSKSRHNEESGMLLQMKEY